MQFIAVAGLISQVVRLLAAAAFLLTLIIALTYLAARQGTINAFGAWARWVRRWGDPLLKPVERRVHRAGGNPQDAPGWLLAAAVVGGLICITAVDWVLAFVLQIVSSRGGGPGGLPFLLVDILFSVLMWALVIRAISSWVGISPYSRWLRPVILLTDWLLFPIRRLLPSTGMVDFSPMVAYILLYFAKDLVLRSLLN